MNKIKLTIAIFALIFVGCSDDDNPATSSTPTLTEGTYNLTDITLYETAAVLVLALTVSVQQQMQVLKLLAHQVDGQPL